MIVCFGEIPELSSEKVIFLSVKIGKASILEFEKFDSLELTNPIHIEERTLLYNTLEQIRYKGAKEYYFKPEGPAKALPKVTELMKKKNKTDFGLRLYCILVNENVLVLLNGGIKTKHNPRECPNVKDHFDRALKIAEKLNKGLQEGFIYLTDREIKIEDNFEFDI